MFRGGKIDKHIFTYWDNIPGYTVPAYIKLCIQTWINNIENLEITILTPYTLNKWINPAIDLDSDAFAEFPPMLQSDIASFLVLAQHGGIFMDADTIVTKDIFERIDEIAVNKNHVFFFGNPGVHMAFIFAFSKHNPFLQACADKAYEIYNEVRSNKRPLAWDLFGNQIISEVIKNSRYNHFLTILDKRRYGVMLESIIYGEGEADAKTNYLNYLSTFFTNELNLSDVISKIQFGLVMLHNSQTPNDYKNADIYQILSDELTISKLLKYALGEEFIQKLNAELAVKHYTR